MFLGHSQQIIGSGRVGSGRVGDKTGRSGRVGDKTGRSGRGRNKKNPGQGWKGAGAPLDVDQRPGRPAQSDEGGFFNLD